MILLSSIKRGDVLVYLASTDARLIPDILQTRLEVSVIVSVFAQKLLDCTNSTIAAP